MSRHYVLIVVGLLLATVCATADAAVIRVPLNQPTIQEGLDAASPGDTVLVEDNTYTGPLNRDLDFGGKSVILRSEAGALNTFIDCQGLGRAFHFHSGEDTTLVIESFTIQNASADTGAGAVCTDGSSPRFLYCRFLSNQATERGGGVYCDASSPVFRFCSFEGNSASGGSTEFGGGASCVNESYAVFQGCDFVNNTAGSIGGAINGQHCALIITACTFTENSAVFGGAGIFANGSPPPAVTHCTFTGNTGGQGSAIYVQSCAITASGCTFDGNGAKAVSFLYGTSTGHLTDCTFVDNESHFHAFSGANATLSNCTFVGSSTSLGSVSMSEASPTFENCIFAFSTAGPAALCQGGSETPSFTRCVLFSNEGGNDLCGSVSDTLHRDPRFCDLAGKHLDLCQNSVCALGNNPWTQRIGALDVGCGDCDSAVEPTTWGSIKALYR